MTDRERVVQTRSEDGELKYFQTVHEAFEYAADHPDVWKISWTERDDHRVRLTRAGYLWQYAPLLPGSLDV